MSRDAQFKLRKILPADISEIKKIEVEAKLDNWSESDYLLEVERSDSLSFVVTNEVEEILGFIIARLIIIEIEIYNIGVKNQVKRQKFGTHLLNHLIQTAEVIKAEVVWLEVRRSNRQAFEFYKSLGFTLIGERKKFYQNPPEDALLMKLILNFGSLNA